MFKRIAARRACVVSAVALVSLGVVRNALGGAYVQTNLVSDGFVPATHTDPNLINPWGMSANPAGGPIWVSDQGTNRSTLYTGNGTPFPTASPLVVDIPHSATPPAGPTGQAFNSFSDFTLSSGGKSGQAAFFFANLDGSISGWNGSGDVTKAVTVVPKPAAGPAVYTGIAIGTGSGGEHRLFAANDAAGKIDVFDTSYNKVTTSGSFTDPAVPAGLSPFNVTNLGGKLYVTYAVPGPSADEVDLGSGAVSVFDTDGHLVQSVAQGGQLASPWGVALAPANFGEFSNKLLVGNFNDEHGVINAFDPTTGAFLGTVKDKNGNVIANSDLWALMFGNNTNGASANTLFFTAGIGDEKHGLFGSITASSATAVPLPAAVYSAPIAGLIAWGAMRRMRRGAMV